MFVDECLQVRNPDLSSSSFLELAVSLNIVDIENQEMQQILARKSREMNLKGEGWAPLSHETKLTKAERDLKLLQLLQLPKYSQEMEVKIQWVREDRLTDSPDEVWVQLSLQEKGDNLHFGDRWDGARSNRNKK